MFNPGAAIPKNLTERQPTVRPDELHEIQGLDTRRSEAQPLGQNVEGAENIAQPDLLATLPGMDLQT